MDSLLHHVELADGGDRLADGFVGAVQSFSHDRDHVGHGDSILCEELDTGLDELSAEGIEMGHASSKLAMVPEGFEHYRDHHDRVERPFLGVA
jgi:hypothetical protein